MDAVTVFLLAIGLAMDAFAVSICKGLAIKKITLKVTVIIGLWFGIFQGVMPIIGFYLGSAFYSYISTYDHWIAFALLALIGANMIREAVSDEKEELDDSIDFKTMLILAIATSIDALAVGISLAMEGGNIITPSIAIAIITMILSMIGVKLGCMFGDKFGKKAELVGGIILIIIGVKIVLEHLGIF